jgi:hypothetical protein
MVLRENYSDISGLNGCNKGAFICEPTTIALVAMAASGAVSAYGAQQQGSAQNKMYQYAAGQSRIAGDAALARAQKQAELVQDTAKIEGKQKAVKTAQLAGAQRAAMAAMGIDPTSVTGQDITLDTYSAEKMDEEMIRFNADRQSWAIESQGEMDRFELMSQADMQSMAGKQAKKAGNIQAFSSLLSTASSMYGAKK